jgi:predicted TIM-barrel fold metal-dependent hydrolase
LTTLGYGQGERHESWLGLLEEDIIEPDLPIIDPHHHLWHRPDSKYLLPELVADVTSGHRVTATVFAECRSMYRAFGPEHLKPVGETEFVVGIAAMSASGRYGDAKLCGVFFGGVDFLAEDGIGRTIEAHTLRGGGRFRGVRLSCGWDADPRIPNITPNGGLLADSRVLNGIRLLASRDLSLDVWLYHTQLPELATLLDECPGIVVVLDHVGSPILGGGYKDKHDEVFADWRKSLAEVAKRPNVFVKLGALPIRRPIEGSARSKPPSSVDVAESWRPWIETCIELFGPSRCMFESNFPVQKNWCSYAVVWNAFKRLVMAMSPDEKLDLFQGTACRAYRILE